MLIWFVHWGGAQMHPLRLTSQWLLVDFVPNQMAHLSFNLSPQ